MIGREVFSVSGEVIGYIGAVYAPGVFIENIRITANTTTENVLSQFGSWDEKFPNWRDQLLVVIVYKEPSRSMTREEVAEYCQIPVEYVSQKIFDAFSIVRTMMTVPIQAANFNRGGNDENQPVD